MKHVFLAALLVVSLGCSSAPALAQNNTTATPTNNSSVLPTDELDKLTNATNGTVTVTVSPNGSVAVQNGTETPTPTSTPTATPTDTITPTGTPTARPQPTAQNETTERIDANTVLVDSRYQPNESVAFITIRSEASQAITLVDAGSFLEGGKPPSRTVAVHGGLTTTIKLPVTERDGYVGVSISTEETPVYAEILERPTDGGLEILRTLSTLGAWGAGILVAFVWMVLAGISVMRGEDSRPEVAS